MNPEEPKRAFRGVWIPKEIWENPHLTCGERCLLAEIESLDNGEGCYASNAFFAKRFNVTEGAIANALSRLRKSGWIIDRKYDGRIRWMSVKGLSKEEGRLAAPMNSDLSNCEVSTAPHIKGESTPERTVLPVTDAQAPKSPKPRKKKEPNPDHKIFIDLWSERYVAKFKVPYVFKGGADASAVSRILTASKMTPAVLMTIAELAWNKPMEFNCKQAVSIAGFVSRFNEIRQEIEVKAAVPKGPPLWKVVQEMQAELLKLEEDTYYQHDRTPERMNRLRELKAKLPDLKRKLNEQTKAS
jgi:hypothetical protein